MGNIHDESLEKKRNFSKPALDYFYQIKKILRNNYLKYDDNDINLETSLQKKSFEQTKNKQIEIINYYWKDFLYEWLEKQDMKNKKLWAKELISFLNSEFFLNEKKFQSKFFYEDFAIQTLPKIIEEYEINIIENENNILNFNTTKIRDSKKNEIELDVTENLGGSFLEMNYDDLLPDDPQIKYQKGRMLVKKYVKIFKSHLFDNNNHPIVIIISNFNKIFCKHIKNQINQIRNDFQEQKINYENYNKLFKELELKSTKDLQKFIIKMENTLKLFYTNCINFQSFENEKDELTNLITNLVFKTGKLYETFFELYSESLNKILKDLQDKLEYLKDVKPEDLGIQKQFCLDELTLRFQKEILEQKRKEKNKLNSIQEDIKENENEDENDDDEDNNNNTFDNKNINKEEEINTKINNNNLNNNIINNDNNNDINISQDDNYISGKKNNQEDLFEDAELNSIFPIRYTVTCFNKKKLLFPKLHQKLRDTIGLKNENITETINNKQIPIPYGPGINLLRSIKKFKTPFEKMMIIASISDKITECASDFWKDMEQYIKKDLLCIEADELMTIFLFIIIKSKMPELAIFAKMIKNFTTSTTRGTMIGYYYTTLEATIAYIEELKDINEVLKKKEQLLNARTSIRDSIRNSIRNSISGSKL